jgi:hypothetical protein
MVKKVKPPYQQLITVNEALKAVYFDFEGNKKAPPDFLGWLQGKEYSQATLRPPLNLIHDLEIADLELFSGTFESVLEAMIEEAELKGSALVSYSIHELQAVEWHFRENPESQLLHRFRAIYINGKFTIDKAFSHLLKGLPLGQCEKTLKNYCRVLGIKHFDGDSQNTVGPALSRIRKSIRQDMLGSRYEILHDVQMILGHNLSDLEQLQALSVQASKSLADIH